MPAKRKTTTKRAPRRKYGFSKEFKKGYRLGHAEGKRGMKRHPGIR